jgi:hypothetical protein
LAKVAYFNPCLLISEYAKNSTKRNGTIDYQPIKKKGTYVRRIFMKVSTGIEAF